jgi:uncharacterized protein YeaO (DUF488 family)
VIKYKRVYEKASLHDGIRILVDRLWPRGVSKEEADLALWLKDISPSNELRAWFDHVPEKWFEFKKRYFAELHTKHAVVGHYPEQWEAFKRKYLKEYDSEHANIFKELKELAQHHTVTFVYAAHDEQHNNAVALGDYIEHHIR